MDYTALMDYLQAGCHQIGIETDYLPVRTTRAISSTRSSPPPGRVDGIVLNPGGYAHYSVAILDALRLCGVPAVEVMLDAPDEPRALPQNGRGLLWLSGPFYRARASGLLARRAHSLSQLLRTRRQRAQVFAYGDIKRSLSGDGRQATMTERSLY